MIKILFLIPNSNLWPRKLSSLKAFPVDDTYSQFSICCPHYRIVERFSSRELAYSHRICTITGQGSCSKGFRRVLTNIYNLWPPLEKNCRLSRLKTKDTSDSYNKIQVYHQMKYQIFQIKCSAGFSGNNHIYKQRQSGGDGERRKRMNNLLNKLYNQID